VSIIKSIKQVLGLGPAAENHFWDGSVANQLTLKRGTPDAPGTELMKFLAGVVSFPNQGQSLTGNGYVKLPGGLIVQWGVSGAVVGQERVTFPIPFPNAFLQAVAIPLVSAQAADLMLAASIFTPTLVDMFIIKRFVLGTAAVTTSSVTCSWIAIGY